MKAKKIYCVIITLIAIILFVLCVILICNNTKKKSELSVLQNQLNETVQMASNLNEQNISMTNKNFYTRLINGEDVSILIVGDSIGNSDGFYEPEKRWTFLLAEWIQNEFGVTCTLDNVSMGGNTSFAGFARVALQEKESYDLAIICYGQNDKKEYFEENYESIIRSLYEKYPGIELISILEHSQKDYTAKIQTIQKLCTKYGIPTADTIASFNESGYAYDELVADGTHPNQLGDEIYFATVRNIIMYRTLLDTCGEWAYDVSNFKYFGAENFSRIDDYSWEMELDEKICGRIGLYRWILPGEQTITITADNNVVIETTTNWKHEIYVTYLHELSEEQILINDKIVVTFDTKEGADAFFGVIVTNLEQ